MGADGWPTVTVDPRVNFGRPTVGAVTTEAVAGMVWAGESCAVVAAEFGLSRHQVLLACWHEGAQGRFRRQWGGWVVEAHPMLGGWVVPSDVGAVPDPPSRPAI